MNPIRKIQFAALAAIVATGLSACGSGSAETATSPGAAASSPWSSTVDAGGSNDRDGTISSTCGCGDDGCGVNVSTGTAESPRVCGSRGVTAKPSRRRAHTSSATPKASRAQKRSS